MVTVPGLPLIFQPRQRSLVRGVALSLAAFFLSLLLAGFPYIERLHGSPWQWLVLAIGLYGMAETSRCLRRRWDFYHAGVLILLYTELMILAMIIFLAVYPY